MAGYAPTIFARAFLLFQMQSLIGKYILPWFGGGPGAGDDLHVVFPGAVAVRLRLRALHVALAQTAHAGHLHLVLLAALLPITPNDSWKPHGGGNPTLQILR